MLSDLTREYYNQRVGQQRPVRFDRANLDRILQEQLIAWDSGGWLQEAFGYHCVDTGLHPGRLGSKFETYLLTEAHVAIAEPFYDHLSELSDADLFSLLEVLVQVVAKPVDGYHHNWNGCGWHYHTFAVPAGRREVTDRLNTILPLYDSGYQMAADGQVELALEEATSGIVDEPLPEQTPQPVQERVDAAVRRFRRGQSSWEDRHAAVRDLGDALESFEMRRKIRELERRHGAERPEVELGEGCCKGHYSEHGRRVLSAWRQRLAVLGLGEVPDSTEAPRTERAPAQPSRLAEESR